MRDLYDTALGAYDAEQTNRVSSYCGERGSRHKRRPWRYVGFARPVLSPVSRVAYTEVC